MATDLGKVGIVMKGAWSNLLAYEPLDAVTNDNSLYIARQNVPAGTPVTNTSYWQVAVAGGSVFYDGLNHNGIYRGKNMGTIASLAELETFLTEHEVSSGKFKDLYLGDYITIQDGTYNKAWMVAGFGTEANKGSTNIPTSNNLSLIPRTYLFNAKMNSTATTGVSKNTDNPLYATTGGVETSKYQAYYGSDMFQITLKAVENALAPILGTHLKVRDIMASDTMNSAYPSMAGGGYTGATSGRGWYAVKASLLSEIQVFGSTIYSSSFNDEGESFGKLPVFNFVNPVTFSRDHYWLRNVASTTHFSRVYGYGIASASLANDSYGVKPLIVVG